MKDSLYLTSASFGLNHGFSVWFLPLSPDVSFYVGSSDDENSLNILEKPEEDDGGKLKFPDW